MKCDHQMDFGPAISIKFAFFYCLQIMFCIKDNRVKNFSLLFRCWNCWVFEYKLFSLTHEDVTWWKYWQCITCTICFLVNINEFLNIVQFVIHSFWNEKWSQMTRQTVRHSQMYVSYCRAFEVVIQMIQMSLIQNCHTERDHHLHYMLIFSNCHSLMPQNNRTSMDYKSNILHLWIYENRMTI